MRFVWSDADKARCVAGATVCVDGSPNMTAGRYVVTGAGPRFVFVVSGGVGHSVPWDRVDPATLVSEAQRELF